MERIPVIIDCDTGIDDAMALVLACASPTLSILGVTTVSGNVGIDDTTRNTCNVLHLLGRDDLRVARGAAKPLQREIFKASGVHGVTGLRGYDFEENHMELLLDGVAAWDYQRDLIMGSKEKVTIIALGPVTNIAILFEKYPEVKERIKEIVFMGTSYHCGNPTILATFNVLVDPEAFRSLLFSGVDVIACSLDVTKKAAVPRAKLADIAKIGGTVAQFVASIMGGYGLSAIGDEKISTEGEEVISENRIKKATGEDISFHDPCTVAYVIAPHLFKGTKYWADVECEGEITLGYTVIDREDYYMKSEEERNLFFLESVDVPTLHDLFLSSVRTYAK